MCMYILNVLYIICESTDIIQALKPMAKVAKDIVHKNGYQDVITVLPKRSTEMTVGVGVCMRVCMHIICSFLHMYVYVCTSILQQLCVKFHGTVC